ncbi:hypothetical protein ClosIBUN13A_CONTIG167g02591 [Clostridium sp. IBUN13A]|nr:hypothetical protein ClosIBUN13A_CONTIG167g02591 [Clostridium sp. IBUN13A]
MVAPGPRVDKHTPAFPVSLPYTSAINAAPCSCLVVINFIDESRKAFITSRFSSPGIPKIYSTPSSSKHFTNNFAVFNSVGSIKILSLIEINL